MFAFIRQHVCRNPHFARSSNDQWAFVVFLFGTHLAMWYELFKVWPHYYHSHTTLKAYMHCAVAIFIYINWAVSLYKFISTKVVIEAGMYGAPQDDWRYCVPCSSYCPPRSHHCPVCNACIIKRDHHCWFTGVCVGQNNHRYYITMVIYILTAAVYANVFHLAYLCEVMGGCGISTVACVLVPHIAVLTGSLSLYQFFVCAITFIALFCLIMFGWLFVIQITQLKYGQTKYERKCNNIVHNQGFVRNMKSIFGEKWIFALMFAWIPSSASHDGLTKTARSKDS